MSPPMRFAYADPPYLGLAKEFYGDATYDTIDAHAELVQRLGSYDGWAMSLHSPSLKDILPLCPRSVRVMAWVKPMCSFKPNVSPAYAWEPVILKPGRVAEQTFGTPRDWLSANMAIQRGLRGAKPDKFAFWIFTAMGMTADDQFDDLFPGSGGISRAWDAYCRQFVLYPSGGRLLKRPSVSDDTLEIGPPDWEA